MRCPWLVLLVSIALLANTGAVSNPDEPEILRPKVRKNRVLIKKNKPENDGGFGDIKTNPGAEERGASTSAVESLSNSLKPADQLDDWLKKGESADDVFKLLTLDKAADDLWPTRS
ncbi:hypothetical protein PHYPSEUDO_010822 [Phytophthora pseudosyringae]|uniref:RxLR effector protein n=1 Tax=Phytophthora pseudosyringae TaxID=221518 RepID=A0A8T1WAI8_9STRA|nr:hypothetical protein PHYPSEUDO_010822 [Phytophthora pseudosyringae]